jgi:predicted ATPase
VLTRIEIDGFKSFADFSLDIPPFLAIVGPNAAGKSNLFDAIQFLGRLASVTVDKAFVGMRGEARELFRRTADGTTARTISFAAEVLLEPSVVDHFGRTAVVTHTRLRYEVRIARWEDDGISHSYVEYESVTPIRSVEDRWVTEREVSDEFRSWHLRYGHTAALLETGEASDGEPVFVLAPEVAGDHRREIPAGAAESTVLSSITSVADHPSLYALKRELQSWQFLHLEPAALRRASPGGPDDQLSPDGGNLALVLRRIERRTRDEYGSLLDEIAVDLTRVVRGVVRVEVAENAAQEQWEVYLETRDEGRISARITSDGTLRALAILTALHDPEARGLICVEEPENGIYPQRLRVLLEALRNLVTNPRSDEFGPEFDVPMIQLLISSHSPVVLRELPADQLTVFDWVTRIAQGQRGRVTRARRIRAAQPEPVPIEEVGLYVSEAERDTMIGLDQAQELFT